MTKKISKREFLQKSTLALGGLFSFGAAHSSVKNKSVPYPGYSPEDGLWKWSAEAAYAQETPRGLKCLICPNECTLKVNEVSDCRTRINHKGKLYTIAYGNPCAVHIDPIEKKPLMHFLPSSKAYSIATAGCNLACLNCQNWNISQKSPKETRNMDLMPGKVVDECLRNDCESIAYTYSEPIVFYEYVLDTAKIARSKGVKNVVVSAGFIHEKPLRAWCKYIDAANIDLKSFDDQIYMRLNAGKLQPVLDTLKIYKEEGVWLEITNLVVPSWTDDLDMIKKMCDWLYDNGFEDTPLHFSRFHPTHKLTKLPATPVQTLTQAREIAMNAGLNYVFIGNVPGTEGSNTYCPGCKKLIIERRGYFIQQNHIKENSCEFCGQKIAGVWK
jgi:pyruvate formate lyase activating enzyme